MTTLTRLSGQYGVILCDPPWAFRTYSGEDRTPTQKDFPDYRGPDYRGEATDHYPTMTFDEMAALPVADLAGKDCALIMWVVGSHIKEAIALGEAWGFTYKTDLFYWLKQKMIAADQIDLFSGDIAAPAISMGYYSRKQLEPVFLFTRGAVSRLSKGVRQVVIHDQCACCAEVVEQQAIVAPRREHSRKPDAQYDRIEAMFDGPYLELFARSARAGWDAWGNETGKFDGR